MYKRHSLMLTTGFALFSMFFGSGNLIFPIIVGKESQGSFIFAALGIILTGVFVPFLGLLGMNLYKGKLQDFFGILGSKGILIFSFCSLALMGPFGVLARCLVVIHGAIKSIIPVLTLPMVSFAMCVTIFILCIRPSRIVKAIGVYLTPLLLLSIFTIAIVGIFNIKEFPVEFSTTSYLSFKNGIIQGYQTMDLLAAFFFSQFVISQIKESDKDVFFHSSLLGGGLLCIVYLLLVILGWIYNPYLQNANPQEMLGIIAQKSIGTHASYLFVITVVLACLTTAIVLASLFSQFLFVDMAKQKIPYSVCLVITLMIAFFVSTFNFNGIAAFLGPILETIYPLLIAYTLYKILRSVPFRLKCAQEKINVR